MFTSGTRVAPVYVSAGADVDGDGVADVFTQSTAVAVVGGRPAQPLGRAAERRRVLLLRHGAEAGRRAPCGARRRRAVLRGGTALVEGKGEQVTELRPLAPCWIVLITPDMVLADKTRTLYGALRIHERTNGVLTRHLVNAIAQGEVPAPALL